MLRKRTRSHHKDHPMGHLMSDPISESYFPSDVFGQKHKNNSFFSVPGVFVGSNPKGSESDSVRSPTSPLDYRVFSNLGNPSRSQRLSSNEGSNKSWGCSKVGLGIVDSLDNEMKQSGEVIRSSDSKNILLGPQMRIKTHNLQCGIKSFELPKSLPKNISIFPHTLAQRSNLQKGNPDVQFGNGEPPSGQESLGKIRSCSLDSGRSSSHFASLAHGYGTFGSENGITLVVSPTRFVRGCSKLGNSSGVKLSSIPAPVGSSTSLIGSISASDIELSEDYTCVRTHGPNAKVTHIFCDCILECHNDALTNFCKNAEEKASILEVADISEILTSYPSSDFLSVCYSCKKNLDGEDIYMYRGEKAFCSWSCRSKEISTEEEMEKVDNKSENSMKPNSGDVLETSSFVAT